VKTLGPKEHCIRRASTTTRGGPEGNSMRPSPNYFGHLLYNIVTLIACNTLSRCRHRALIGACVSALSERMDDVAASTEWETEWLSLDREQLVEFIRSSELTVKDEWDLWQV